MLWSSLLVLLPLVLCETEQRDNNGIKYYGTSHVRYQKTYMWSLPFHETTQFIPIPTTTTSSPYATRPVPITREISKITQFNTTTSSGPFYQPPRKPFVLPRPTRPEYGPKQQAIQPSVVVALQPTLLTGNQSSAIPTPQPSIISVSQSSIASASQVIIQLTSNLQTPLNTTLQASTIDLPIPTEVISPTSTLAVSLSKVSSISVQPEKELDSFDSKPELITEPGPVSLPQVKPIFQPQLELNLLPTPEQIVRPEADTIRLSTSNFSTSGQVSDQVQQKPIITVLPVLEAIRVVEPDTTILPLLNETNTSQEHDIETHLAPKPEIASPQSPAVAPVVTQLPEITIPEIQTPVGISSNLPVTKAETQVISAPHIIIQLITNSQLPLNAASQQPLAQIHPTAVIHQPLVNSVQFNVTINPQIPAAFASTQDNQNISEVHFQQKTGPSSYEPEKVLSQKDLELSTQSELKKISQIPYVVVSGTDLNPKAIIDVDTSESPPQNKSELINVSAFELPINTTPLPLQFIASQPPPIDESQSTKSTSQSLITSDHQPSIMTSTSQPAAAGQGSSFANTELQNTSAHIIIQLITPSKPSASFPPLLPVSPALKPEAPERPYLISKVSDSELNATQPQSEQATLPESEVAPHLETEIASLPEAEISSKSTNSYSVKTKPTVDLVTAPESTSNPIATKQAAVLQPLSSRPNNTRDPANGRYNHSTSQYLVTAFTNDMTEVPLVIKPTYVPFFNKPNTIRQSFYTWYTHPTTQNPILATMPTTSKAPQVISSTPPQRSGSLILDFVCKEENGYYAVDNECDTYIECQQNHATKFSCPDGLYFNPAAKYNEYPCVYSSAVQCVDGIGKQTEQRDNNGIKYYGTSNIRYQKTYPLSLPSRETTQFIPIPTTTTSPPYATRPVPITTRVSKITQLNITSSSGSYYKPRRKPFVLPRPTRPKSEPDQQGTQPSVVVAHQPILLTDNQSSAIPEPQPSIISVSQPSIASVPQVVIQLTSDLQTLLNTTLQASTINMPIPTEVISPTPTLTVSLSKVSPVSVQPEKELDSFDSKSELITEPGPVSLLQAKPIFQPKLELNPLPNPEQILRPEADSIRLSTSNVSTSGRVSDHVQQKPILTVLPITDPIRVEELDTTILPLLIESNTTQEQAIETHRTPKPEIASPQSPAVAHNPSLVHVVTQPPVITIPEIQPPDSLAPNLPVTKTESQVISAPHVIIQLITNSQLPLNAASQQPLAETHPTAEIHQPPVNSVQFNVTINPQLPAAFLSTPDNENISAVHLPQKTGPNSYEPEIEIKDEPESFSQPDLELTTQSELKKTSQLTFLVVSGTDLNPKAIIDADTSKPPFQHESELINVSAFELLVNATPQPLQFTASQLPPIEESQPTTSTSQSRKTSDRQLSIITSTPQPVAAGQGSGFANSETQNTSAHIIIQLITPAQPSASSAPLLPVSLALEPEVPEKPYQLKDNFTSKVLDSELKIATQPQSEQAVPFESEVEPHIEIEIASKPEAEISSKPTNSFSVKTNTIVDFVTAPEPKSNPITIKQAALLSPLLPRSNNTREPAYGRYSHPTTQYSIAAFTNDMTKVPLVIKPTHVPLLNKPGTVPQPFYDWYTQPTTQYPITATMQSTSKAPQVIISSIPTQRSRLLLLDFVCKEENGYYAVENECDTYIECQKNNATKFSCPDGLYFNPAAKYDEYPCVYSSEVQCVDGIGKETEQRDNNGIKYYGTSDVYYRKTYLVSQPFRETSHFIPIPATITSPPSVMRPAPTTTEVSKITQLNITTSSGPSYKPRRKPFVLPMRPTRPGSRLKQQTTQPSGVVTLQPTLFADNQSSAILVSQPSTIPVSQPSIASAPQIIIQLISDPQTPLNTTLQASAIDMPIAPVVVSPTVTPIPILQIPALDVSLSKASPVSIQPEKELVSFGSTPELISELEPISLSQAKPSLQPKIQLNPLPSSKQILQPDADSIRPSTSNFSTSGQVLDLLKQQLPITPLPVIKTVPVEEPVTTILPFFNEFSTNLERAIETQPTLKPEIADLQTLAVAANLSSAHVITQPPVITGLQTLGIPEIQPPVTIAPNLKVTETDTQVISVPHVIIQLTRNSQLPSHTDFQQPLAETHIFPTATTHQPAVKSNEFNITVSPQPSRAFLSTPDKANISEVPFQPINKPKPYEQESDNIGEAESVSEPELTTQSELEKTSKLTFLVVSGTDLNLKASIDVDTSDKSPVISESASEPPFITTPQQLAFMASQPPPISEQQHQASTQPTKSSTQLITTSTPQPVAAGQRFDFANTEAQNTSAHIIIQLITPFQPSASSAALLPVSPPYKPEAPERPYQPKENLTSKGSGSELKVATQPDSKQATPLESNVAPHLETEIASKTELDISSEPTNSYSVKTSPTMNFVTAPEPTWNPIAIKQAAVSPLLPRAHHIREPAYDRYSHPTTQYSFTALTNDVTKVPLDIKPLHVQILNKPNTVPQHFYAGYNHPTTPYPITATMQISSKAPQVVISRSGSSILDFVCKEGNRYYAVHNECDTYIECQQNNATKFSCPDGLYFNPAAEYNEYPCVYSSEVQCVNGISKQYPRPTRQCPKQYGLFPMNNGDCSKYIMCNIGVATVMSCPAGLVFNPSTESCDWLANVPQCSNPQVFKDFTCPDAPNDEYGVASDIITKYKYGSQCKLYIACQRGYPRLLSCEPGLAFDEASQSCVGAAYVQNCLSYPP